MIRKDWNDQISELLKKKMKQLLIKIIECKNLGQPLLVFTASINKSEHYSKLLEKIHKAHSA